MAFAQGYNEQTYTQAYVGHNYTTDQTGWATPFQPTTVIDIYPVFSYASREKPATAAVAVRGTAKAAWHREKRAPNPRVLGQLAAGYAHVAAARGPVERQHRASHRRFRGCLEAS